MSLQTLERSTSYGKLNGAPTRSFSLLGDHSAHQEFLSLFAQRNYHHDPYANVTLLLDTPLGFGLHTLQNRANPSVKHNHRLIIVTQNTCPEYWDDLQDFHPCVILLENELDKKFDQAFAAAQRNEQYRSIPEANSQLTATERKVLRFLSCGCSNPQIADELGVQHKTIRNSLTTIYEKLGVENRTDALLYYWGTWHGFSRLARA